VDCYGFRVQRVCVATARVQIAATDRQIDQLVYELYGMTAAGTRSVEEGTAK
jgi:hypothetical protein